MSRKDREFKGFFRPKLGDLQKKKRSSPKFRVIFRPKSKIQRFFPPEIRWSPKKKKKKKKKVFAKIQSDFSAEIQIQRFFPPEINWSPKKKKKKVFAKIQGDFSSIISQVQTFEGGLFSYGGGYFPFFTENRPQKHKKHAILLHNPMGGARSPPAPPLATLLPIFKTVKILNVLDSATVRPSIISKNIFYLNKFLLF